MEQAILTKKIESIEKDLESLKTAILKKSKNTVVSLKGILNGIKVTEKDIDKAKKSLFNSS